jgi:hypothetical protein
MVTHCTTCNNGRYPWPGTFISEDFTATYDTTVIVTLECNCCGRKIEGGELEAFLRKLFG